MAKIELGIFDTPPSRQQILLGVVSVGLLLAIFVAILPVRNVPLPETPAFVPMINSVMFVCDLIIGTQIYAQAKIFRSRALIVLASGYISSALILGAHTLTFPGAFATGGLLGAGVNTTAWLGVVRLFLFPISIIPYAVLKSANFAAPPDVERAPTRVLPGVLGAIVLAAAVIILTTRGHALLPTLFLDRREGHYPHIVIVNAVLIALILGAITVLFLRRKSVLDVWLLVALSAWLVQQVLNLLIHARFSIGWYSLNGLMLVSHLVVMLALMAETSRLYAKLALATAARDREREARLMSMDAVAAAIAHEIGQPLAAISMNAGVCLRNLSGERPDPDRAIKSTRSTLDAAKRAFEVIKSVRAMYSKGGSVRTEFSLNDLVVESAALMEWEITAHRISMDIELDPGLPQIEANRVQLQRILVNLITNAIEALGECRDRRIGIRTAQLDNDVLLEVTDSGVGIPPENIGKIFEPFVTTKKTGTGLGLSLCRVIVEEHGGRLWATPGDVSGVTFHLQLPRIGGVAAAA